VALQKAGPSEELLSICKQRQSENGGPYFFLRGCVATERNKIRWDVPNKRQNTPMESSEGIGYFGQEGKSKKSTA
jgi:hypothetical protein